jgi:hypothetical protein
VPGRSQATRSAANRAAALLRKETHVTGEGSTPELIWSRALAEAIEPLRYHPALPVRCACDRGLGWARFGLEGVYVTMYKVPKKGPITDQGRVLITEWSDSIEFANSPVPAGFENEPAGAHVWARRRFVCRPPEGCDRRYTFSSHGLLLLWLQTIGKGDTEIRLGGTPSAMAPATQIGAAKSDGLWSTRRLNRR